MKNKIIPIILSVVLAFALAGCTSGETPKDSQSSSETDEFGLMLDYLELTGNYLNSDKVPSMITAQSLYNNLGQNIYIIDIRNENDFAMGHIPGAKNIPTKDLLNHFENRITPTSFSHIVISCYSGQSGGYVTALLRLLGYNNVYNLKFGMSAWNMEYAKAKWLKNLSNTYADSLEKQANRKHEITPYPKLNTGEKTGLEILRSRVAELLEKGYKSKTIKAEKVFENTEKYYTICYWPEKKYYHGHIPGAIQYTPKKSLARDTFLNTLPTDQTIVTYCNAGQHSAFVTAYLNLLGYDAKSLKFGVNSFMNGLLVERGIKEWHAFTEKNVMDFPIETGSSNNIPTPAVSDQNTIKVSGGC